MINVLYNRKCMCRATIYWQNNMHNNYTCDNVKYLAAWLIVKIMLTRVQVKALQYPRTIWFEGLPAFRTLRFKMMASELINL